MKQRIEHFNLFYKMPSTVMQEIGVISNSNTFPFDGIDFMSLASKSNFNLIK